MRIGTHSLTTLLPIGVALLLLVTACADEEKQLGEFMERGLAAVEAENDEEAIIEFRNVIQLDPNDADAHFNLADALSTLGQLEEAVAHFERAVELRPEAEAARRALERARSELGSRR